MNNQERSKTIGGSDVIRIMAGDWHSLWMEKTGRVQPEDLSDNVAVQLGIYTEAFNIDWFCSRMNVSKVETDVKLIGAVMNSVPIRATLDGLVTIDGTDYVLECKHTHCMNTMSKQLDRYMPQLQLYMAVSRCTSAYFSNIFGNNKIEYVKINRDEDYIRQMMVHVKEFWSMVEKDHEPPNNENMTYIETSHIEIDDMIIECADGDNMFLDQAATYIETKDAHASHESAKKNLKSMVGQNVRELQSKPLTIRRSKNGSLRFVINKGVDNE